MNSSKTDERSTTPNNLPPRPSPFVNREEEIRQAISALLDSNVRAVALVGIAGIGKTSLALEIAYHLLEKDEFTGGIIWLPARELQSSADLTHKIATILRVSGTEVYSRLSSQHCLIILDGLDELNHRFVSKVERFLGTLPNPSKALVTSRKEFALPPQATVIRVSALSEQAAIELFRALADRYRMEISDQDRLRIRQIASALDYHPLALTLAARFVDNYAQLYFELGVIFTAQGRWYDALPLLEESLAIRRQNDDLNARADTIYQIARVHHLMGNLDKARIHYRDALRLYQHTGNSQGVAACETGLGRLMIQMGFVDDAVRELDSAKRIYYQLGDDRRIAEVEDVLHVATHIKERQSA